jgi:hypothetical protein
VRRLNEQIILGEVDISKIVFDLKSQGAKPALHLCSRAVNDVRLEMARYVVDNDLVGLRGLTQGAARVVLLPACWVLACNPQGPRCGSVHTVA